MSDAAARRFTLARPWMLAIGLVQLAGGAAWAVWGTLIVYELNAKSEVRGSQLIDAGAIVAPAAEEALAKEGIRYTPGAPKMNGLGAYFVTRADLSRLAVHQNLATGWLVLTGFAWVVGSFSLLSRETGSSRPS